MTWFKVDDAFWSHPKTLKLSAEAIALWVRAGSYASQNLTDGVIESHILAVFGPVSAAAEELVFVGYWEPHERGFAFHDWADYQPSKGEVEARRESDRQRKAEWRSRKESRRVSRRDAERTDGVTPHGIRTESALPDPTRPDPTISTDVEIQKKEEPNGSSKENAQGKRLPDGWMPPAEEIAAARTYAPHVDLKAEHERFTDYWLSTPGIKGRKTDWLRTWRNWVKKAEADSRRFDRTTQGRNRAAEWGAQLVPDLEAIER